jgi:hypothetical protein
MSDIACQPVQLGIVRPLATGEDHRGRPGESDDARRSVPPPRTECSGRPAALGSGEDECDFRAFSVRRTKFSVLSNCRSRSLGVVSGELLLELSDASP